MATRVVGVKEAGWLTLRCPAVAQETKCIQVVLTNHKATNCTDHESRYTKSNPNGQEKETVRVRGLRVYGPPEESPESPETPAELSKRLLSESVAATFHHLAKEVFGEMLTEIDGGSHPSPIEREREEDRASEAGTHKDTASGTHKLVRVGSHLREHVVALLFDRAELRGLNDLQCSVYDLIFRQLENESARYAGGAVHDDVVGFELCNMAASLSGSDAGRDFMAHPPTAMTLLRLLSCSSSRVQRQVPSPGAGMDPRSL